MDTKQNTPDNYQINSFSKGMNSDVSYDLIGDGQYLFGQNIRITNNTLLTNDITSNTTENVISPIPNDVSSAVYIDDSGFQRPVFSSIMASESIEDIGAIIIKDTDKYWHVYKVEPVDDGIKLTYLLNSKLQTDRDRFSVVINKELQGVTKLYIADGVNEIMQVNIEDVDYCNQLNYTETPTSSLIDNKIYPLNRVKIADKVSGKLKTQQVQYTYRFYKRYGVSSRLSPLTNKIQVIDGSRSKEVGNAEDTETSIGFKLRIADVGKYSNVFDHIQIFRLSYIKPNSQADVYLVCDSILQKNTDEFVINDTGESELAQYTIDEFSAIYGTVIKPNIIEQNQGYLFAANVSDDTIFRVSYDDYNPRAYQFNSEGNAVYYSDVNYTDKLIFSKDELNDVPDKNYINKYVDMQFDKVDNESSCMYDAENYLGGTGPNISWRFITTRFTIDDNSQADAITVESNNEPVNFSYINDRYGLVDAGINSSQYFESKDIEYNETVSYTEMLTSSLLRSLRRGEVYRYGIVFYDEYGVRSDVLWIADIKVPTIDEFIHFTYYGGSLSARPIGIQFMINKPHINGRNIVGYQIVRCQKTDQYSKTLLQVALSRPLRQGKYDVEGYRTPYYPNVLLTTQFAYIDYNGRGDSYGFDMWNQYFDHNGNNVENFTLYQALSPEINIQQQDVISMLSSTNVKIHPLCYVYDTESLQEISRQMVGGTDPGDVYVRAYRSSIGWEYPLMTSYENQKRTSSLEPSDSIHLLAQGVYIYNKMYQRTLKSDKQDTVVVRKDYRVRTQDELLYINKSGKTKSDISVNDIAIKAVSDAKEPQWNDGFTVDISGGSMTSAAKHYKSFNSAVGSDNYVNWVSNGKYDLAPTSNDITSQSGNNNLREFYTKDEVPYPGSLGWIGPGPRCVLLKTDMPDEQNMLYNQLLGSNGLTLSVGTVISNIQHVATQFAGMTDMQKQYDTYYGFGNFGKFDDGSSNICIFDGNIYIVPAEIINMYKAYDFNDQFASLKSGQVVYYIPTESKINTMFDYGCNFKNTQSKNIMLEPGSITGIAQQDRPAHQYNMIYSDNESSNDIFSTQTVEDLVSTYDQRIYYSQLKTNGESIDNWSIFKPADYLDVDSKYGQVTNMLTVNNTLYFWQPTAFGKLSVNERSLVTDDNSNVVQLGQGGVLQRADYIDTRYGMREQDFSALSIGSAVYWIDITNRAVVTYNQQTINYGEYVNVQNIINKLIDDSRRPTIDYDLQNMEILCNFLKDNDQLVFNVKYGYSTSVYTRRYDDIVYFNNVMYSILIADELSTSRLNYLSNCDTLLSPVKLSFVVNSHPSQTKVFDNQKIVTLKRNYNAEKWMKNVTGHYFDNTYYTFTTDICQSEEDRITVDSQITDREGNICYAIPRYENKVYGNRVRGKWMKEDITNYDPKKVFCISHIITKFRQSYS